MSSHPIYNRRPYGVREAATISVGPTSFRASKLHTLLQMCQVSFSKLLTMSRALSNIIIVI